jgi:hypothetical protein
VSEYVGAGALAPIDDWHGFEVLKKATEQFPDNLLVWFAFAYRYFRLKREDRLAGDEEHDFDYILTELSALDFTNSVPLYLRAAVVVYKEDLSLARNLIADATLKPLFVTHEAGIRRCIAHSAESIDYPLFTARAVALLYGEIPGVLNGLGKTLCNDLMSTAETIRHCLVMGRRLEETSQFIIANIAALGIQSVAIRRLPARGEVVDLARIQERSTALQAAADYLDSAHLRQMDEERWVNYFDKVFASTEEQAVNELSAEHGKS